MMRPIKAIDQHPTQYEAAQQAVIGVVEYEVSLRLEAEQNAHDQGQEICQLVTETGK